MDGSAAVPALVEDLGLTHDIHTVAHNWLELQAQGIWCPLLIPKGTRHIHGLETDRHIGKTPIHIHKIIIILMFVENHQLQINCFVFFLSWAVT